MGTLEYVGEFRLEWKVPSSQKNRGCKSYVPLNVVDSGEARSPEESTTR